MKCNRMSMLVALGTSHEGAGQVMAIIHTQYNTTPTVEIPMAIGTTSTGETPDATGLEVFHVVSSWIMNPCVIEPFFAKYTRFAYATRSS